MTDPTETDSQNHQLLPDHQPCIMMVAGEASGDVHAAALLRSLKKRVPGLTAFGMGGPKLREAGLDAVFDSSEISVMGLVEVIPKLFSIMRILRALGNEAAARRPDLAVLVDVPDFNLRLARRLKKLGIPVVYYVSPMFWASRPWRVRSIRRLVDKMLCILPFEEPWLRERGVDALYVGNPVLDALPPPGDVSGFRARVGLAGASRVLTVIPGSRPSEIARVLPVMCEAVCGLLRRWPDMKLLVPRAPALREGFLEEIFSRFGLSPTYIEGRVCDAVGAADAAIVCSGTAALEAGLMLRPFVVVYRVQWISALVFRLIRTVDHISLVNILAGREIIPELFQKDCTPEKIEEKIAAFFEDDDLRGRTCAALKKVRDDLGTPGASDKAAAAVAGVLENIGRLPAGSRTIRLSSASSESSAGQSDPGGNALPEETDSAGGQNSPD